MENQIKLVFQGKRLTNKNTLAYTYGIVGTDDTLWFARPLNGVKYHVGRALDCSRTETGVAPPYKIDFDYKAKSEDVRTWSLADIEASEHYKEIQEAKKPISGNVTDFVDQLRDLSRAERARIIRYLIMKLL